MLSVATDNVGHREAAPTTPDAVTQIGGADTTPPVLSPVADQTKEATSAAGAVATFAATATDNVDGTDPVVFKEGTQVVHSGDTFSLGTHIITASATDAAGNPASETFTIKVMDTTAPILTPVDEQTKEATSAPYRRVLQINQDAIALSLVSERAHARRIMIASHPLRSQRRISSTTP